MRNSVLTVVAALVLGACGGDAGDTSNAETEAAAVDPMADSANAIAAVDLSTFSADPEAHVGHEIRLANVPVDSRMGQQGFWLKLPNQGLYLVRGTAANNAGGQPGAQVTVAGAIREMTDSVVTAWIEEGSITADQEMEARYATSYMDAWYVSSGQQAAAGAAQE